MWLVCYDITSGSAPLRRVAKICESAGVRVQKSVFEMDISDADWVRVRAALEACVKDVDSLRIYAVSPSLAFTTGRTPELSTDNMVL